MDAMLPVCGDGSFGPSVKIPECRGGFDFTIFFEESILVILPTIIFLLLTPIRAIKLFRRRLRVKRNALYISKLVTIGSYIGLQVAVLILTTNPRVRTDISVASATLSLISALALAVLSHLEHVKSVKPSLLINLYLILTVLFDGARVRTHWLVSNDDAVAGALSASLAVKCIILVLEAIEKRSLLFGLDRHFSLESTSGLINRSSFWWLNSLLLLGFKKVMTLDNLPAIYEKLDSVYLATKLQSSWDTCNQRRKHALEYACVLSLRWEILIIFIPRFLYVGLSISQAYLIQDAVRFVQGSDKPGSISTGYGLIGAFAFVYIGLAILNGWTSHLTYRLMTMMRGELVTVIYAKMLTLQIINVNESAAMTLMGTDVQRIAETFHALLVDIIPSVIQVSIAVYLLYVQLGAVCIAPILVTIASTALSMLLAGHVTTRQKVWLEAVQRRINYTSEILGSMRNVKLLGLTDQMSSNIDQLRSSEIGISKRYRKVQALNISLVNLPSTFNGFFVFATYAIVAKVQGSDGLSVSQAITSLAALRLLAAPLGTLLFAIPSGWAALGCFARIQEFLLEISRKERRFVETFSTRQSRASAAGLQEGVELSTMGNTRSNEVVLIHGSFGWSDSNSHIIKDASASIRSESKLTMLVGPVGCGKSTFLKGLLGETPEIHGQVRVSSSEIAYCDQTPWIINGSIQDNIVAGSEFDSEWYATVIHACALDTDIRQMSAGDLTIVGNKGVKLSGGQKQRLCIARAVYCRKGIAIFDDVLSGLDSLTEELVFQRAIGPNGLLRKNGTTVILATHSVKRLPQADLIFVLDHAGQIVEQGNFAKLNVPGNYIHTLQVECQRETKKDDNVEDAIDPGNHPNITTPSAPSSLDESRSKGDWSIYKYYAHALGFWGLLGFIGLIAVNGTATGMGNVWLNWWAQSNENGSARKLGYWLGMLGFLNFMEGFTMVSAVAFLYTVIVPRSGTNLHRSILGAAMRAPLSFFTKTDTGVLVNRFSQDLRLADMTLPGALINCVFQLASCIVVVAISVTAVGYFAAIIPVLILVLYFIQNFYLRTSRQLRLLELEASAPLYSHFIESLAGLITIRSFGWTDKYIKKNQQLLDESQKPYYLLFCIQRWLILVLDLVVAGLAVVLVAMAVSLRSRINPGFLGLALVNMMNLSHSLTNLVEYWTSLETSLGGIARIKDFSENTPAEETLNENLNLDAHWPSRGALRFDSVSASYGTKEDSLVLKNLSFTVEGGQRIGIVGRTGSGKSSSTLAIMRLIDLVSGTIILDDIDLSTIPGSIVRERIICLTQDPFLFPASVRSNVDPLTRSSDEAIITALKKVGLWDIFVDKASGNSSGPEGVLDSLMDTNVLSHGQRQLFCLARAMLKSGKVLILDEPTSSVDTQTDARMQELIRDEFQDHTVIMIAHRLSSLLAFDRVVVLDKGQLLEFGNPTELLNDSASYFSRLYNGVVSM